MAKIERARAPGRRVGCGGLIFLFLLSLLASCAPKNMYAPQQMQVDWGQRWVESPSLEWVSCLTVFNSFGTLVIAFERPPWKVYHADATSITFNCGAANGFVHNHPSGSCGLSDIDTNTLENTFLLGIVICGERKLVYKFKGDKKETVVEF